MTSGIAKPDSATSPTKRFEQQINVGSQNGQSECVSVRWHLKLDYNKSRKQLFTPGSFCKLAN